jgi:hypothetical protein
MLRAIRIVPRVREIEFSAKNEYLKEMSVLVGRIAWIFFFGTMSLLVNEGFPIGEEVVFSAESSGALNGCSMISRGLGDR